MLRRMSLTGDAMSHAILPGAAIGFLFYGLNIVPMTIGGIVVNLRDLSCQPISFSVFGAEDDSDMEVGQ